MPKVTSGGASNAWEGSEPVADQASGEARLEAVAAEEPDTEGEAQPEPVSESEPPLLTGEPSTTGAATVTFVADEPIKLPPGWSAADKPAGEPEPAQTEPATDAVSEAAEAEQPGSSA